MAGERLPSFDLVVATVGRVGELERLLASLETQTHRAFRVLLVDQNEDDRLESILSEQQLDVVRLRAERGLSRARNAALGDIRSDLVAFPDDDCLFAPDLLERVARRFAGDPALDGVTGRALDEGGHSSSSSWARDPASLTRENLWNRAISFTIFLRAPLVARAGRFDEQLGLGAGSPWTSGEEIDYLVRALDAGARIEYDPSLTVTHPDTRISPTTLRSLGHRDGASVGYILRKHAYPKRTVGRMLIRPIGGALVALARRDRAQAAFQLATLRGRLLGYRG